LNPQFRVRRQFDLEMGHRILGRSLSGASRARSGSLGRGHGRGVRRCVRRDRHFDTTHRNRVVNRVAVHARDIRGGIVATVTVSTISVSTVAAEVNADAAVVVIVISIAVITGVPGVNAAAIDVDRRDMTTAGVYHRGVTTAAVNYSGVTTADVSTTAVNYSGVTTADVSTATVPTSAAMAATAAMTATRGPRITACEKQSGRSGQRAEENPSLLHHD
jgi:hypothetical protein